MNSVHSVLLRYQAQQGHQNTIFVPEISLRVLGRKLCFSLTKGSGVPDCFSKQNRLHTCRPSKASNSLDFLTVRNLTHVLNLDHTQHKHVGNVSSSTLLFYGYSEN